MSQPQTHFFNAPYQLSIIPQKLLDEAAKEGGKHFRDQPSDSVLSTHTLKHGDLVLFCTDGLLDNLSPAEYLQIVNEQMLDTGCWILEKSSGRLVPNGQITEKHSQEGVDSVAKLLVEEAFKASLNTKIDGPFAREAQRSMHIPYKGGYDSLLQIYNLGIRYLLLFRKPDDITVLVMLAQQKSQK